MAPLLEGQQQWVSEVLSEQLGAPVTIGGLSARWSALRPGIDIRDISIIDDDGHTVLSIKTGAAQIDLLESLISLRLRLWNLEFHNVDIHLQQTTDGWQLQGSLAESRPTPVTDDSQQVDDPLDIFLLARIIEIKDANAHFHSMDGETSDISLSEVLLQNDGKFHRFTSRLDLPGSPEILTLVFEGYGDPRSREQFSGRGFLGFFRFPLLEFEQFISAELSESKLMQQTQVDANLWLDIEAGGNTRISGDFNIYSSVDGSRKQVVDGNLFGRRDEQTGWLLDLIRISARDPRSDRSLVSDLDVQLTYLPPSQTVTVSGNNLDLQTAAIELAASGLLPQRASDFVADLSPTGTFESWLVSVPLEAPMELRIQASVVDGAAKGVRGVPGFTGVTGFLDTGVREGSILLQADKPFSIDIKPVYEEPLHFSTAMGEVRWSVNREQNQVLVYSGLLSMTGPARDAKGVFYLDVPFKRRSRAGELYLQIGLNDAPVGSHKMLVPSQLPKNTLDWLDQALVGGQVDRGGFIFRSYIGPDRPSGRTTQLLLSVNEGELRYLKSWPSAELLSGIVQIDNQKISGEIDSGLFLGSAITELDLTVASSPGGGSRILNLSGRLSGPAEDGLAILTDTPLRQFIPERIHSWEMDGSMSAEVELSIPLSKDQSGTSQKVAVNLSDTTLTLPELSLSFSEIEGKLIYDSKLGISSEPMALTLWDLPFRAELVTEGWQRNTSKSAVNIGFEGTVNPHSLANWSQRPELYFISGDIEARGQVTVPLIENQPFRLVAESDLSSVAVELPEPFGKSVGETNSLRFEMTSENNLNRFQFHYGDSSQEGAIQSAVAGTIEQNDLGLIGVVSNREEAGKLPDAGIEIRVDLEELNGEEWLEVVSQYQTFQEIAAREAADSLISNLSGGSVVTDAELPEGDGLAIDVEASVFLWDDFSTEAVSLNGRSLGGEVWAFDVDSPLLAGEIQWLGEDQPVAVDLQRLSLSVEEDVTVEEGSVDGSSESFLSGIDPASLLAVDFSVDNIMLNEEHYGSWAFELRPVNSAVRLNQLEASVKTLNISGDLEWSKRDGFEYTFFDGNVSTGNLKKTFKSWEAGEVITSESAELNGRLLWLGSPLELQLDELYGPAKVSIKDGKFLTSGQAQAGTDMLRLLGLFNFDSWLRRLRLDFTDVYESGMAFDEFYGDLVFGDGYLFLERPISIETPSAKMQMGGVIDLENETLDSSLVVTLPIAGNATTMAALLAGLPVAAGVYVINKILNTQVEQLTSASYRVTGEWSDPSVKFNRLFDRDAAREAGEKAARTRVENAINETLEQ